MYRYNITIAVQFSRITCIKAGQYLSVITELQNAFEILAYRYTIDRI